MNAKLLPRDLDACFEDCGGVHEAEGGAVTVCVTSTVHFVVIIQPHQHQGLRLLSLQMFMLLMLNEPDVCICA